MLLPNPHAILPCPEHTLAPQTLACDDQKDVSGNQPPLRTLYPVPGLRRSVPH